MADQLIQLGCSERSDTVLVNVLLSDSGGVESLLVHNDDLVCGRLAVLKVLDDGVDVGSLERIALTVVVPAAGKEVSRAHLLQSKPITITSLPTPWEMLALSRASTAPFAISSFSA